MVTGPSVRPAARMASPTPPAASCAGQHPKELKRPQMSLGSTQRGEPSSYIAGASSADRRGATLRIVALW
jgi:hypothetical protein